MIRGVPLFVFPWDPLQGLVKPEHKSCPLWVKLHNIPLVAFNREGVARIASALGVPKMMDDFTTSMCDKAWGRPGFAKVLVDVWAIGELKKVLDLAIPNPHGGQPVVVPIQVEYMWEPSQCSHCLVFGHKVSSCVKAVVAKKVDVGKAKRSIDDSGFTVVSRRKGGVNRPSEASSSGVVKPTMAYRPVVKPAGIRIADPLVEKPKEPAPLDPVVERIPADVLLKPTDGLIGKDGSEEDRERVQQTAVVQPIRGILKKPPPSKLEVHPAALRAKLKLNSKVPIATSNSFSSLSDDDEDGVDFDTLEEGNVGLDGSRKPVVSGVTDTNSSNSSC